MTLCLSNLVNYLPEQSAITHIADCPTEAGAMARTVLITMNCSKDELFKGYNHSMHNSVYGELLRRKCSDVHKSSSERATTICTTLIRGCRNVMHSNHQKLPQ